MGHRSGTIKNIFYCLVIYAGNAQAVMMKQFAAEYFWHRDFFAMFRILRGFGKKESNPWQMLSFLLSYFDYSNILFQFCQNIFFGH